MDQVLTDTMERELERRYLGRQFHQRAGHPVPALRRAWRAVRHTNRSHH